MAFYLCCDVSISGLAPVDITRPAALPLMLAAFRELSGVLPAPRAWH